MIGSNIKFITITGLQILNQADKAKEYTLHRELMQVESIQVEKVIIDKGNSSFKGRLFYAIVPNRKRKSVEFYFSKANAEEARSVANALPLFICDFFIWILPSSVPRIVQKKLWQETGTPTSAYF